MNKVILLGRLVRDPEVRYTQSTEPLAVCSFTVAVDKPYSRKRQEGDATADFINCICFGKRGESIGQYFRKGNRIAVTGRINTRDYTDQQGNKRYVTEVVTDDFEFVDFKSERVASERKLFPQSNTLNKESGSITDESFFSNSDDEDDSDLPFN